MVSFPQGLVVDLASVSPPGSINSTNGVVVI